MHPEIVIGCILQEAVNMSNISSRMIIYVKYINIYVEYINIYVKYMSIYIILTMINRAKLPKS